MIGMMGKKICPFMSKPGTQMHTVGLVDAVYCQEDACQAWYQAGEYCWLIHPRGME